MENKELNQIPEGVEIPKDENTQEVNQPETPQEENLTTEASTVEEVMETEASSIEVQEAEVPAIDKPTETEASSIEVQEAEVPSIDEPMETESAIVEPTDVPKVEVVEEIISDDDDLKVVHPEGFEDIKRKAELKAALSEDEPDDNEENEDEEDSDEIDFRDEVIESLSLEKLAEALEEVLQADDLKSIKAKVALIKVNYQKHKREKSAAELAEFIQNGGISEDFVPADDDIDHKFKALFGVYREKRNKFNADLENEKQSNLQLKQDILEELRNLINSDESLKKTYDDFREVQERWRHIGIVPKAEVNTLWQNYHFLVEKFFDKVRINKELKDLDLKKNLESKVELCEKAEELLLESSIMKSFKDLQKLHELWKEIGPVPQDKKDEVWERFKDATDKINSRRREHYDSIHSDLEKNHESKLALIEKAKELVDGEPRSIKEWQERTNKLDELFKIWKSIGPAPRKVNDEVWGFFKAILDEFFNLKSDYFNKIKEQQLHNYNLKLDLCVQAESLMTSTDWRNTTRDLISLQKEWKKIGPVPRKHSDKIWKRFRAACDAFFNAKDVFFSSIHENESTNLQAKLDLITQVREHAYSTDKSENLSTLKDFQRKWMDIGHVPIKEKDKISQEFRKVINAQLDKLNISSVEMSDENFRSRVDNMKDGPEGQRHIIKEINFLHNKVTKMNEDITLWENNLGFFAESKNANLLKGEFERKIQKARQEVKLIEVKIKYLRDELKK
ncbi:MAG: DUF349 domain-containing protein [Bacteroidales bacterium]|nr:DUF349 domain-containing protein [Bacteroidales bacterium]